MDRIDRTEHVKHIIGDIMSDVGADEIYRNDPQYHAQIYQLIQTLSMVDETLENEGVSHTIRNKIFNTCFLTISDHTKAAIRLEKSEAKLRALLSDWDK